MKMTIIILCIFSTMLLVSYLLEKKNPSIVGEKEGKGTNIVGFRGLLAMSVLSYHFQAIYTEIIGDRLHYIAFFSFFCVFLGYFFGTKIFDKSKEIDWLKLYQSRFWRLVPMHTFVVVLFVLSAWLYGNGFKEQETLYVMSIKIIKWLIMGLLEFPEIGELTPKFVDTNWTLKFDVIFYLFLPFIYIILRRKKIAPYILILPIIAIILGLKFPQLKYVSFYFLGGIIISYLYKNNIYTWRENKWVKFFTMLIFVGLIAIRLMYDYANVISIITTIIISGFVIFGYDLYGFFRLRALQFLGTISYSIYLLHSCIFNIVNYFIIGLENIPKISYIELLGLTIILSTIVVCISLFTYKHIEERGMKLGKKLKF